MSTDLLHTELPATHRAGGSVFRRIAARYIVPAGTASSGLRLGLDIETNELLDTATKLHCIVITNLDTDQVDAYGPEQIAAALEHLFRADYLVGHNILEYDLRALHKLRGWTPKAGCRLADTLIASRLILPHIAELDDQCAATGGPKLGKLRGRYSIEAWGLRLGMPKVGADLEDFSTFTPEMLERCVGDTAITKRVWQFLQPDGYSQSALALEHRVSPICGEITAAGMFFDTDAAARLKQQWEERRGELAAQLQQQFPGTNLNSHKQIAALLEARGWTPEKRTKKTKQPVIDGEVLETIATTYPEFTGLSEHAILGRRLGQLVNGKKAWTKSVSADGRIHGGIVHVGTPHSRAKHLDPNLAQVPNPKRGKPFATECRSLFKARDGWVLVACDQAALQDRGFAHYLAEFDDGAYAKILASDIDRHWKSSTMLGLVSAGTERNKNNKTHALVREGAKGFYYGFLFGAQDERAGRIIYDIARAVRQVDPTSELLQKLFDSADRPKQAALKRVGKKARDAFMDGTPGLRRLRDNLEAQARRGWLPGLDGRRVPVRALYTSLNYAVTSAEAIICKRWLVRTYDELHAKFRYGWDGDVVVCLWAHDEIVACCRPEIAAQVGEILVRHAKEPGEFYDFKVPLDAEYKVSRNWGSESIEGAATSDASMPAAESADRGGEPDDVVDSPDDDVVEAPISGLAGAIKDVQALIAAAAPGRPESETPPWEGPATFGDTATAVETAPAEPPHGNGHAADGFDAFPDAKPGGKILCPFHDDHNPSLEIYPSEPDPHYHCWACGAHGPLDDLEIDWETALKSPTGTPTDADNERNLARAHELWDKAKPIAGTLAERYLAETRGIDVSALPAGINEVLRFLPRCPFGDKRHPCLIALFRDIETGERAGIHRIALTPDAQKIERRMFGRWPRPRAIKLWPADDKLYVGEGIETVLAAATQLQMRPTWALATNGYLETLPTISGIAELGILVDRDAHGEAAAAACHQTWKDAGRRVRRLRTKDASLNDFNDLILKAPRADWAAGFEEIKENSAESRADSVASGKVNPAGADSGATTPKVNAQARDVEPVDLWGKLDPPPLPTGLLPEVIERFAVEESRLMGADVGGLALGALAVCAAAVSDRTQLQVKQHSRNWTEPARIWVGLIGNPSTKKTPIILRVAKPLKTLDAQMWRAYLAAKECYDELSSEQQKSAERPKQKRLRIEDTTIEAAQEVLKDSPDGVLCIQPELSGWFGSMDKYAGHRGAAKDRGFWLQSYDGGTYAINRIKRGAGLIENLSISLLGGIQPEPLRKIAADTVDDGLLQRLIPIVLRPGMSGKDEPITQDAGWQYDELIERLHHDEPPADALRFDGGAQAIREQLEQKHLDLMAFELINKKLASHIGKYDGLFARLCVLWHCIEGNEKPVIAENTARRAADFMHRFLLPHAFAFYGGLLGFADDHERLTAVAGYILAHKLERVTNRDVQRGVRTMRGLTRRETESIFEQLDALGWITRTPGPRPAAPPHWIVNPGVHRRFVDRAEREAAERAKLRDLIKESGIERRVIKQWEEE